MVTAGSVGWNMDFPPQLSVRVGFYTWLTGAVVLFLGVKGDVSSPRVLRAGGGGVVSESAQKAPPSTFSPRGHFFLPKNTPNHVPHGGGGGGVLPFRAFFTPLMLFQETFNSLTPNSSLSPINCPWVWPIWGCSTVCFLVVWAGGGVGRGRTSPQ